MLPEIVKKDLKTAITKLEFSVQNAENSMSEEDFQDYCDDILPIIVELKDKLNAK